MKLFGTLSELTAVLLRTATGNKEVKISSQTQTGAGPVIINIPDVGDNADNMVVSDATQTLLNKTLTSPVINTPTGIVKGDVGLGNVDNTSDATKNAAAVTLTNKTLTSPVISSPSGLVKGDVGLGNVDNTSDATKNAAVATLTNKTLTSPVINTPTGIVKGDVGLGNVDNTSDATKNAASVSLTNKTIGSTNTLTGATAASFTNTGTVTLPTATDTLVGRSTTDTLLNKTVVSSTAATTGALTLPSGTAAQRPTPTAGMTRLNTDSNSFEGYANGIWSSIGGGLNEQPVKNYLKTYAESNVAPGTVSIAASGANITVSGGTSAFYADAGAAAIVSDASTLLRGANNYLTAVTGASTSGTVYVQFPAVTLETADAGKPISISFDTTGNTLDNDWDVVIANYDSAGTFKSLIPVAGNASSMTGTASAKIPTGTSTFNGFFISTSTAGDVFALRLRRRNGSVQIRVDSLMVGNTPVRVGAAVTDWQAYTPTYTGWGTPTSDTFYWRRSGDTLHVRGRFVTGTTTATEARISFPNGLTSSGSIATLENAGFYQRNSTGPIGYEIYREASVGYFTFGRADALLSGLTKQNGSSIVGSGAALSFEMSCPIANWSSNVTMADRAVEEYSFNTATTTTAGASDTTSFGYGASGTVFNAFNSTTANSSTTLRCRFQTPIQATDSIRFEYSQNGTTWIDLSSADGAVVAGQNQADSFYGANISRVSGSTTDVDVSFGNKGRRPNTTNATAYAANGDTWSGITARFWRLRKVSSGAQVGGAISTANIVGRVDGSTVGSGYLGEQLRAVRASSAASAVATATAINIQSITLTAGVWDINAVVGIAGTLTGTQAIGYVSNVSATLPAAASSLGDSRVQIPTMPTTASDVVLTIPQYRVVVTAATEIWYVGAYVAYTAGSASVYGRISAVRIA